MLLRGRLPVVALFLVLFLILSSTLRVQAGPPYITDDPEPEELHHWEINLATIDFKTAGSWSGNALHADIAYGLLPDLELNLLAPFSYDAPRHESGHLGYGDTQLGFKYRLAKENGFIPEVGFAPFVVLPTGDHDLGLGDGKAQLFLPLWLQKTFGRWTSYGGGGYFFNPGDSDNRDYWFMGLVVQRKMSETFNLGMEIFRRTADTRNGSAQTALNLGATLDLSEHFHILVSAGHSVEGPGQFLGYLAFQITLGPEEKKETAEK